MTPFPDLAILRHLAARTPASAADIGVSCRMTALERAVVAWMMSAGDAFRPFDAASMAAYRDEVGRSVETPEVQTALEQLRATGVVVRLDRGRYAADDVSLPGWQAARFPRQLGDPSSSDVSRS